MKYYAVKKGRNPGIYETWEDCKEQVDRFSDAVYKSFLSKQEAVDFLNDSNEMPGNDKTDCVAYIDGSYDHSILAYGWAAVIFFHRQKYTLYDMDNDKELAAMRNVAGEITASMQAMTFAMEHQCRHLEIYYDYEGIEKWCTGAWQAKKKHTQAYRDFYLEASKQLQITFKKVKSHSHHALNDEADRLAKKALGIL